ncbi:MAG: hypothetical protein HY751_09320 [Nitrospinae bacterium]|nr:hypothetical protein [Nitrospinota bacterium]
MKINGFDPSQNAPGPKKAAGAESKPSQSFLEVLNGMTSGTEASAGKTSTPGILPTSQVPFIAPPVGDFSTTGSASGVLNQVDGLLTDLSMFKNALGNLDIPMERLAPLAKELSSKKDELAGMIGSMSDGELKKLVTDALDLVMGQIDQYYTGYAA